MIKDDSKRFKKLGLRKICLKFEKEGLRNKMMKCGERWTYKIKSKEQGGGENIRNKQERLKRLKYI